MSANDESPDHRNRLSRLLGRHSNRTSHGNISQPSTDQSLGQSESIGNSNTANRHQKAIVKKKSSTIRTKASQSQSNRLSNSTSSSPLPVPIYTITDSSENNNSTTTTATNSDTTTFKNSMSPQIEMQRLSEEASTDSTNSGGLKKFFCIGGRSNRAQSTVANYRTVNIARKVHHQKFVNNSITTAKYNAFTFLPMFLFEQFRKYSNIFFLFIALMQQIPNVSPTGRYTTAVPLLFILTVSAIKEIFEDVKRHKADRAVNSTEAPVFNRTSKKFSKKKWKDIAVGDLVLVEQDNSFFPSDLVLLSSNEPNGLCYIETSNLDGETNLKARSSLSATDDICCKPANQLKELDIDQICSSSLLRASIECDLPNKQLYEFYGKLKMDDQEYPMGPDNILLRGAKMRNTQWALGCVIYTGHETKLMMNSLSRAPLKQSHVEMVTNQQILSLLGILLVICMISAICSVIWTKQNQSHWYITEIRTKLSSNFFLILLTFIILYNNLIPISLQVTLEMVRFIQAHFINCDLEMYCEETDTPAMARTSNLNEELGQVRYILSDKTGTLTRNVMEFKKCSIGGIIYDDRKFYHLIETIRKKEGSWEQIREFLTLLAVCHTVIPEPTKSEDSSPRYTYQASSPDEAALVKGAQSIGFEFLQRTPNYVLIDAMGTKEKYEILNVLDFNSDRKRMSVIVRAPNKKIKLFIKGADSVIQERLCNDSLQEFGSTETNLTTFATDGLRTLCCAYSTISDEKYKDWENRYNKALLVNNKSFSAKGKKTREEDLNQLMSEIESDLTLLGATAIEDKLQVGVPEAIDTLIRAGINIWMLTGDKQETATNIGYSCRLLKNVQILESYYIINSDTHDGTRESISIAEIKIKAYPDDFTLIIDNKSLNFALQEDLQSSFIDIAIQCRSVICCRVSPAQKAEIVDAVKKATKAITLAIGDGANDVAMIRAAHVGVGISGREGLQAVYSSDYSIAQFRFLARLLLVHGSWSFSRVCKLILYSFYKNIALYVIELWFASISAWSGQAVFERWSIGLYNVIFTAGPPLVIGLFDRVCSADVMLNNPELYQDHSQSFSIKLFWIWIGSAIWHSLVLFWLTYFTVNHDTLWSNGKADGGYLCFGNILYTYVVITVCLKAALETSCWTVMTHVGIWGSIASWFIFLLIYCRAWPALPIGADISSIDEIIFSTSIFWLGMAIIPFVALLVDIVIKLISRTCFKSLADKITELEMARSFKNSPTFTERARLIVYNILPGQHGRSGAAQPPTRPDSRLSCPSSSSQVNRVSSDMERDARHGYSFSQEEGTVQMSQSKVIRMYNTRM